MQTLRDLVVVELAGSVAGAYCAKMFVDGGARVTLIGESALSVHQRSYLDQHKQIQAADTIGSIDWDAVDVIIESSAPGSVEPIAVAGGADHLVRVQISPFGLTGERAHWSSTDLTDYAISGHSYLYGDPAREPLRGPADQPAVASGIYGFIGAMAALLSRDRLGHGQSVDISHIQVMVALHQVTLLRWMMNGSVFCRMGNRYTGQGQPNGPYPCRNGWVSIVGVADAQVEALLAVTGLLHLLDHPDISSPMDFQSHPHLLDEPLIDWLSDQDVDDVVELFQAMRIPTSPLLAPDELIDDPQLVSRAFFKPLTSNPRVVVPGAPFSLSDVHPTSGRRWQPGDIADGPLAGLKILDLARVWAGPMCARILRDLGAEVVWVEAPWHRGPKEIPQSIIDASRQFPDDDAGERQWNRNSHFVKYALGKQSLAIDLQTTAGQQVLARMVPQFHVLLENFSTRVMPQLGFDEAQLHALNPDLIYLTMPGFGRSGPAENWLAYGSCVDSHAGLSSLIGYRDQTPWKGGVAWPDPIAGLHAASATLSVLWSQLSQGTGGLTIEAAQLESTVAAIGDRIVEAQIDGRFVPDGNRHESYLAQGVYQCAGEDNWLAVSVPSSETMRSLLEVLGQPEAPRHHDQFDAVMSAYCATRDALDLEAALQAAGVPAGKVAKAPDIMADPHLQSRNAWETFDQPDIGTFTAPITPIALSATMPQRPSPAPTLGQHNEQVLRAAGLSTREIAQLADDGIIATEPPH